MRPYYQDESVTLYCADFMEVLPHIPKADAIITDPPYGTSSCAWDKWVSGWPQAVKHISQQLWCFGSFRMFMNTFREFSGWKLAQDIVWEKHNGSSPTKGRFRCRHELAVHFYQGLWRDVLTETQYTNDATARTVLRKKSPPHWGDIGESAYASHDGGKRQMVSVMKVRSCHGYAVNETQKPEDIVKPIMQYSVPEGGLVVDCFAGSGTTGVVAVKTGRRAILVEKRKSQCDEIISRLLEQAPGARKLRIA